MLVSGQPGMCSALWSCVFWGWLGWLQLSLSRCRAFTCDACTVVSYSGLLCFSAGVEAGVPSDALLPSAMHWRSGGPGVVWYQELRSVRNPHLSVSFLLASKPPLLLSCPHRCLQLAGSCPLVKARAQCFGCSSAVQHGSWPRIMPRWFLLAFHFSGQCLTKCCSCDEVTSCTGLSPAALVSSCASELLLLSVSEEFTSKHFKKTKQLLWKQFAEVSPSVLSRCDGRLHLAQHALLCAGGVWVRSTGMGAALPTGVCGHSAHLCVGGAASFCCMYCKHESWMSGTVLYRTFFFWRGARFECMFTCPRSKVLNTKVTISWMDPSLGALLSSGNPSCCPFSPTFAVPIVGFWSFHFQESYVQKKWKQLNVQAITSWVREEPLHEF